MTDNYLDEAEIIAQYVGGKAIVALSKETGISRRKITNILKKADVELRNKYRVFTDEEMDDICARYLNGEGAKSIGRVYCYDPVVIKKIISSKGITLRTKEEAHGLQKGKPSLKKLKFTDEDTAEMIRLYAEGTPPETLATKYGCTRPVIKNHLRENGVTLRTHAESVKLYAGKPSTKRCDAYHFLAENEEWLREQRIVKRRSIDDVAEELGCSTGPISDWCKKYDIPDIGKEEREEKLSKMDDYDLLFSLYKEQRINVKGLSELFSVPRIYVSELLKKHGIPSNPANSYPRKFVRVSKPQQEIADIISSCDYEIEMNNRRILDGLELDILIPSLNLAIEYNGLFHHSEEGGKGEHYHLNKTKSCAEKGIALWHIWDDEWRDKKDIIVSMLLNKLHKTPTRIYARQCKIVVIDHKTASEFLDANHLQGKDYSSSVRLGLTFDDTMVACMTFGKPRYGKRKFDFEINRYCNLLQTNVIGGFSKLLKEFERTHNSPSILSYADRSHSKGNVYERNGFVLFDEGRPSYAYTDSVKRHHRFKYRNGAIDGLKEKDAVAMLGLKKIWNCGNLVYVKNA